MEESEKFAWGKDIAYRVRPCDHVTMWHVSCRWAPSFLDGCEKFFSFISASMRVRHADCSGIISLAVFCGTAKSHRKVWWKKIYMKKWKAKYENRDLWFSVFIKIKNICVLCSGCTECELEKNFARIFQEISRGKKLTVWIKWSGTIKKIQQVLEIIYGRVKLFSWEIGWKLAHCNCND